MYKQLSTSLLNLAGCQALIASYKTPSSSLEHFQAAIINQIPLMRSEYLSSKEKCRDYFALAISVDNLVTRPNKRKPLRLGALQLNLIAYEWDFLQEQHRMLLSIAGEYADLEVSHVCLPTEYAFFHHNPEMISEFTRKAMDQLLMQFNSEAWLVYCSWLNQECALALKTFQPEASEEYQLQALLEDFGHEVRSPLLAELQKNIAVASLEKEDAIKNGQRDRLFHLEEKIVSNRAKLSSALQVQGELLGHIVEGISKIESMHAELLLLKRQAMLLHQLVTDHFAGKNGWSWGKKILLLHLLDEQLDVLSAICCDTGIARTNMVFSIRLALAELKANYAFEERLNMSLAWDDPHSHTSEIRKKLQKRVLRNLTILKMPTARKNEEFLEKASRLANFEMLRFLPPIVEMNKAGKSQQILLFDYDALTGKISGCTPECWSVCQSLLIL